MSRLRLDPSEELEGDAKIEAKAHTHPLLTLPLAEADQYIEDRDPRVVLKELVRVLRAKSRKPGGNQ
jgi:hypothetical protein